MKIKCKICGREFPDRAIYYVAEVPDPPTIPEYEARQFNVCAYCWAGFEDHSRYQKIRPPTIAQIRKRLGKRIRLELTLKEIIEIGHRGNRTRSIMKQYEVGSSCSSEGGFAIYYSKALKDIPVTDFGEALHLRFWRETDFENGKSVDIECMDYHVNMERGRRMIMPLTKEDWELAPEVCELQMKRCPPYPRLIQREIRKVLWDMMNRLECCARALYGFRGEGGRWE